MKYTHNDLTEDGQLLETLMFFSERLFSSTMLKILVALMVLTVAMAAQSET